nr:RNA-directed DNA polymerase, eukaryota [Tanacetum cinerariifolium]
GETQEASFGFWNISVYVANFKIDELAKISLSVYVANFPSHLTVRELWNICGRVGNVADVYIVNRTNKLGQMFGFCRFIKVVNSENLIHSLFNIWVGKLRLHANVARYSRKMNAKPPSGDKAFPFLVNKDRIIRATNNSASYANVAKSSTLNGCQ